MPDFKELVKNLYATKGRELTEEKLSYIETNYGKGKEEEFVKNFYATIGEELPQEKFDYIRDTYLKKKEDGGIPYRTPSAPVAPSFGTPSVVEASEQLESQSKLTPPQKGGVGKLDLSKGVPVKPLSGDMPIGQLKVEKDLQRIQQSVPKVGRETMYRNAIKSNENKARLAEEKMLQIQPLLQEVDNIQQAGGEVPQELVNQYNNALPTYNALLEQRNKSIDNIEYFNNALEGNRRLTASYTDSGFKSRFLNQGLDSFGSLVMNSIAGTSRLLKQTLPPHLAVQAEIARNISQREGDKLKARAEYTTALMDEKDNYLNKEIDDIYKEQGLVGATEYALKKFTESLPVTLGIMAASATGTGGAVLANTALFGGSANQRYEELKDRTDMTEEQKIANAVGYGSADVLFEGVLSSGMGAVYKQMIKTMGKEAAEKAIKKNVIDLVTNGVKKYMPLSGAVVEGVGEGATQLTQNIVDKYTDPTKKDMDVMEGVGNAAAIGFAGGGAMSAPTVLTYVNRSNNVEKNKEIEKKREAIQTELAKPISESTKEILQQTDNELMQEQNKLVVEDMKDLTEKLPEEQKEEVKVLAEERRQIENALAETESEEVKTALENKTKQIGEQIDNIYDRAKEPIIGRTDVTQEGLGVATETGTQGVTREGVPSEEVVTPQAGSVLGEEDLDSKIKRLDELSALGNNEYFNNADEIEFLKKEIGDATMQKYLANGWNDDAYVKVEIDRFNKLFSEQAKKQVGGKNAIIPQIVSVKRSEKRTTKSGIEIGDDKEWDIKFNTGGDYGVGYNKSMGNPYTAMMQSWLNEFHSKNKSIKYRESVEGRDNLTWEQLKNYNPLPKQEAVEQPLKATEEKVSDALKDVESTARALEGKTAGLLKEPTLEQRVEDLKNKNISTFTYERESDVPLELKDKISSRGEKNGKPFVNVTLSQIEANYLLNKDNPQAISEAYHNAKSKPEAQRSASDNELITSVETLLKPKEYATQEVKQPKGVRTEPEGGIKGGETKTPSVSDSVQRTKESEKEREVAEGEEIKISKKTRNGISKTQSEKSDTFAVQRKTSIDTEGADANARNEAKRAEVKSALTKLRDEGLLKTADKSLIGKAKKMLGVKSAAMSDAEIDAQMALMDAMAIVWKKTTGNDNFYETFIADIKKGDLAELKKMGGALFQDSENPKKPSSRITLAVFDAPQFEKMKGLQVTPQSISDLVKGRGKQIEKDIINMVLDYDKYKGQKRISFDEFRGDVETQIMKLEKIRTRSYADYGYDNLGDNENYGQTETVIFNSPIEHGEKGHFSGDFTTEGLDKIEWELRQIPNTDKWAAVDKNMPSNVTANNLSEYIGTAGEKIEVEKWIADRDKENNGGLNKGLFGHIRKWFNKRTGVFNIAELQSDYYQKNKASDLLKPEVSSEEVDAHMNKNVWLPMDREISEKIKKDWGITVKKTDDSFIAYDKDGKELSSIFFRETPSVGLNKGDFEENQVVVSALRKLSERRANDEKLEDGTYKVTITEFGEGVDEFYFKTYTEAENFIKINDGRFNGAQDDYNSIRSDYQEKRQKIRQVEEQKFIQNRQAELEKTKPVNIQLKQFVASQKVHELRLLREAIKMAADEGAETVRFPSQYTLAVIEGYVDATGEGRAPYEVVSGDYDRLYEGDIINYGGDDMIVVEQDRSTITVAPKDEVSVFNIYDLVEDETTNRVDEIEYEAKRSFVNIDAITREEVESYEPSEWMGEYAKLLLEEYFQENESEETVRWKDISSDLYDKVRLSYDSMNVEDILSWSGNIWQDGDTIYAIEGRNYETFSQPDEYEPSSTEEDYYDNLSSEQRTVVDKYGELGKQFEKMRPDSRVVRDDNGMVWLETTITEEDKNNPIVAFQEEGGKVKGAIDFTNNNKATLYIFDGADISTLAHEMSGHLGRRVLERLAEANPDFAKQYEAVKKWAGVKDVWTTKAEEKFARAFERYLRNGVAPTKALKEVFSKLKEWLSNVYKVIKNSSIDINLTNDVRETFDALLGKEMFKPTAKERVGQVEPTEIEITQTAQKAGVTPKNLRDLYKINRELFGLDRIKSLASAIAMDRIVGAMAKRAGITKEQMYGRLKFEKDTEANVLKADNALFQGMVDGKPVTLRNMDVDVVNGFYSPLEKIISETKQEKMPAKQWLDKFARGEEAKWTGLQDWLSQQQGSISKQDILNYLKDNRIVVVEVVKGDIQALNEKIKDAVYSNDWIDLGSGVKAKGDVGGFSVVEINGVKKRIPTIEAENLIHKELNTDTNKTKFSQYQLEGEKEKYKEVLVMLPSSQLKSINEYNDARDELDAFERSINIPTEEDRLRYSELSEKVKELEGNLPKNAFIQQGRAYIGKQPFRSTHFDELDILVHLRMNTRMGTWEVKKGDKFIDGNGNLVVATENTTQSGKVLFLEEVQSDWGQTGKKEGFIKSKQDIEKEYNEADKKLDDLNNKFDAKYGEDFSPDMLTPEEYSEYSAAATSRARLGSQLESGRFEGVPTAPFVMDTNAWTKLGLKVALKEAVKQGADKIAWTTGTQQFDRWGTEKIDWVKTNKGWTINIQEQFRGTAFAGMNIDKKALSEKGITITSKEDLRAAIDRTLSREKTETERQKLTDRIWDRMQKEDSGTSLPRKEGMESFYGTEGTKGIVGGVAEKLFGQKVGETDIIQQKGDVWEDNKGNWNVTTVDAQGNENTTKFSDKRGAESYANLNKFTVSQPSIDVTPALRAEVERGLALFQRQQGQQAKGAMVAADGAFVIYALTDPNVSTPLHEMAHVFEHYLNDAERVAVQNWAGTKAWTTQTSEAFARGFEKYLAEGKAPTPALQKIFEKFKQWLTDIYNGIKGSEIDIELNDQMREIYAKMLGAEAVTPTKAERKAIASAKIDEIANALKDILPKIEGEKLGVGQDEIIDVIAKAVKALVNTGIEIDEAIKQVKARLSEAFDGVERIDEERIKVIVEGTKPPVGKKTRAIGERYTKKGYKLPDSIKYYQPMVTEEVENWAKDFYDQYGYEGAIAYIEDIPMDANPETRVILGKEVMKRTDELFKKATSPEEIDELKTRYYRVLNQVAPAATTAARTMNFMKSFYSANPFVHVEEVQRAFDAINQTKIANAQKMINELLKINGVVASQVANNVVNNTSVKSRVEKAKRNYESSKAEAKKLWQALSSVGIAETPWERARKNVKFDKALAKLAKDFIVYQSVKFEAFLKEVAASFGIAENDIDKDHLKSIFDGVKSKEIQKGIKGSLRDLDIKFKQLIEEHYTDVEAAKESLADKLSKEFGLAENDAKEVAELVRKEFNKLTYAEKLKQLKNSGLKKGGWWDTIIDLSNAGALSEDIVREQFAKELGIAELTPEIEAKLIELSKAIRSAPENTQERARRIIDLEDYKKKVSAKFGFKDYLIGTFLTNIFGSMGANEINMVHNIVRTKMYIASEVAGLALKGDVKQLSLMFNALANGYKNGYRNFSEVFKTGKLSYKDVGEIKARNIWELMQIVPEKDLPLYENAMRSIGYLWLTHNRFWSRMLQSFDALSGTANYEIASLFTAIDKADELGLKGSEREKFIKEQIARNPESVAKAKAKAKQDGLKEGTKAFRERVEDYIKEQRPKWLNERAKNTGQRLTLTQAPDSSTLTGYVANVFNKVISDKPFIKFIMPVTNTISNLFITQYEHTPLEAINWLTQVVKNKRKEDIPFNKAFSNAMKDPEMRRRLWATMTGTAAGVALFALAGGFDKEENCFEIFGAGSGDIELDNYKKSTGWKPYSVRFNCDGDYYSYQWMPLFAMLVGMVGDLRDYTKYGKDGLKDIQDKVAKNMFNQSYDVLNDEQKSKVYAEIISGKYNYDEIQGKQWGYVFANIATTPAKLFLNYGFMTTLKDMFEIASGKEQTAKKAVSLAARTSLASVPVVGAGWVREVKQSLDPNIYKTTSFKDEILKNIPFVEMPNKVKIDGYGRNVTFYDETSQTKVGYLLSRRFKSNARGTDLDAFWSTNGIKITPPDNTEFYNDENYQYYAIKTGEILYDLHNQMFERGDFEGRTPEDLKEIVRKTSVAVRNVVKGAIKNGADMKDREDLIKTGMKSVEIGREIAAQNVAKGQKKLEKLSEKQLKLKEELEKNKSMEEKIQYIISLRDKAGNTWSSKYRKDLNRILSSDVIDRIRQLEKSGEISPKLGIKKPESFE